jgi:hypothetical protein
MLKYNKTNELLKLTYGITHNITDNIAYHNL